MNCIIKIRRTLDSQTTSSALTDVPMKALAIVILSHILSRTSRPDSGQAMALATVAMSLWMERWKSSNPGEDERIRAHKGIELASCAVTQTEGQ